MHVKYYAGACDSQLVTAYRPIDHISPLSGISRLLTERVPDDRHHGRGAAHFLATFIAAVNVNARSLVRVPLAAGGRVSTVGHLLFATLHGPGRTQPSVLSGPVNEYRLRLGRFKVGMCDAADCAPCT